MSGKQVPTCPAVTPIVLDTDAGEALELHLSRLVGSKETLERQLLHCQEQLNLVFAVTEQISNMQEPDAIQETLLRHYGVVLKAGAVFLDRAGCCTRVALGDEKGRELEPAPTDVRATLADHVEAVRRGRHTVLLERTEGLDGARALLSAFPRPDTEMGVVVALRDAGAAPFDANDVLASESVLVYGAKALSNAGMVRDLRQTALETVCALVNAIDAKDNYTSDHSERVGGLARLTGEALELPKEQLQTLEWAGYLHDVGKIGVPELILNKPGKLTEAEYEQMKKHPRVGYDMLKPVGRFETVLEAVLYHHENHDGSGYPEGLREDQIPLAARIIHVVDVFDALTTTRPYRSRYDLEHAIRILEQDAGRVTDPRVTHAFIAALRQYVANDPTGFRVQFGYLAAGGNVASGLRA
ncbi:MAG: HD-GYP domain-containing protein [Phycisphaerae bacterium]|nr:HD-GYP domain-containing protein [Phycisphaerae bacterium]